MSQRPRPTPSLRSRSLRSRSLRSSRTKSRSRARGMSVVETLAGLGVCLLALTAFSFGPSQGGLPQAGAAECAASVAFERQLARVDRLRQEGAQGHRGLDAVVRALLQDPSFTIEGGRSGRLRLLSDLDGDGRFEELRDLDRDGLGAAEVGSGAVLGYDAGQRRYALSVVRVEIEASYPTQAGGLQTRLDTVVIRRPE